MWLTLSEWRDVASISGVVIALVVYISNTCLQRRQRRIENAMRFYDAHHRLFENEFLADNIQAMEAGTFKRDRSDHQMEKAFNRLLGEIEHVALLQTLGAIPAGINVYMFGWFAQRIQPVLTAEERGNVYWEVAVKFLDDVKTRADEFYKMSPKEREHYFRKCGYKA